MNKKIKKKRIPIFTLCGLFGALLALYFNNKKESTVQNQETFALEHALAATTRATQETAAQEIVTQPTLTQPATPDQATLVSQHQPAHVPHNQAHHNHEQEAHAHANTKICTSTHTQVSLSKKSHAKKSNTQEIHAQTPQEKSRLSTPELISPELTKQEFAGQTPEQNISLTSNTSTITIKNNITPAMLSYTHWTGTYTPSIFTIEVNDTVLEPGQETILELTDNTFTVSYYYSFMNGYKSGARKVTFKADSQAPLVELGFSWQNEWHVVSNQAAHESIENIDFKERYS